MQLDPRFHVTEIDDLEQRFGAPSEASIAKVSDRIDANYRALVLASPFVALATSGPRGLDVSPRGDAPGFVRVLDDHTLVIPDRRGNNRLDSLRNILVDPRVALLFLIPGLGETLRINGRAAICCDPALLEPAAVNGIAPKLAIVVSVELVFFQCSRAVVRADLWNPSKHVERERLPTPGKILADLTAHRIDGDAYDEALPARVKATLY
ncbi:pyridoxamine 5'-phosphate oxidase family protein [Nannocystaceae bacterium ST9]